MPASKNVDLAPLVATVTRAKGVMASAKAMIQGQGEITKEAVRVAVAAALADDNLTDDQRVDAVMTAVDAVNADLTAGVDDLATGLTTNT